MSTENWNRKPGDGEEVDARQVEDAHVRRSEEESDRTNPDVEHNERADRVTPEEVESFKQWQNDEQKDARPDYPK